MASTSNHNCLHLSRLPSLGKLKRPLMLVGLLVGLAFLAAAFDLDEVLSPDRLKATLVGSGLTGLAVFTGAFTLGVLLYLPGMMFVGIAGWLWGPVAGPLIALAAGVFAVTVSFGVYRGVGGKALGSGSEDTPSKLPARLQRWLGRMEQRPVTSVAVMRLFLWVAPPLNTALALTSLRWRDYILGSALGLAAPIAIGAWIGAAAA